MDRYLLYQYNDMAHTIACSNAVACIIRPTISVYEFFSHILNQVFLKFFGVPLGINLLIVFFCLFSLLSAYYFFNTLHKNILLSLVYSIFYTFSNYALYRYFTYTYTLFPIFLFPLLLGLLFQRKYKIIPIILILSYLLSVYYCYYLFIITIVYFAYDALLNKGKLKSIRIGLMVLGTSLTVIVLINGSLIKNNIPIFGNYADPKNSIQTGELIYRPIDDWYNFSIMPWYLIIPPKNSVWFGDLSKSLYGLIENTGYYLADNFEATEMSGLYLGWHNLFAIIATFFILVVKKWRRNVYVINGFIYKLGLFLALILTVLFISLPPSFTLNEMKIFTPSHLIYNIFAPIRVQARWGVVLSLASLTISYLLLAEICTRFKRRRLKVWVAVLIFFVNLVLMSVTVPIIDTTQIPEEMVYLAKNSTCKKYVVYPKGSYKSIFWSTFSDNRLLNATGTYYSDMDYFADRLNKVISSDEGMSLLKDYGVCSLVFYINAEDPSNVRAYRYFLSTLGTPVYMNVNAHIFRIGR